MKFETYKVFALSQALSPITHMSGTAGNEAILMSAPVMTPEGKKQSYCLTGNALRHKTVREPGARHLIAELGMIGEIDKRKLNFLMHGGDRTDKGQFEDIRRQARMNELIPFLKLVAGSLPDQIMKGFLAVHRGMLVCEETREVVNKSLPDGWTLPTKTLYPAEQFVGRYQYVRGDVEQSAPEFLPADHPTVGGDNRMINAGQTIIEGSIFFHGYHLAHASLVDIGCLLHCLDAWQAAGGIIGGQSAKGHGRLFAMVHVEPFIDMSEAIAAYLEHVRAHKDECRAWMDAAFNKPPEVKVKKEAKGKKAAEPTKEAAGDSGLFDQE